MTNPERIIEEGIPGYVKDLMYQVASGAAIGSLAFGVARVSDKGGGPEVIFEIAEVTEPGLGIYANTPEAGELRRQLADGSYVRVGSPAMWREFTGAIIAGEMTLNLPEVDQSPSAQ